MSDRIQFNMRVDDVFINIVDKIRQKRTPVKSASQVVRDAVMSYYNALNKPEYEHLESVYVANVGEGEVKIGVSREVNKRVTNLAKAELVYCTHPRTDARGVEALSIAILRHRGFKACGEFIQAPVGEAVSAVKLAQAYATEERPTPDAVSAFIPTKRRGRKNTSRSVNIGMTVNADTHKKIMQQVEEQGCTMSDVINQALALYWEARR